MRKTIVLVTSLLTTLASTAGNAADLNLIGSVSLNPCTVTIPGGNKFNFGTIKTEDLHPTEQTHFTLSKEIRVNCPSPSGFWVAFPFDNGGELQTHGNGRATGRLDWWSTYDFEKCLTEAEFPENQRVNIDEGDGIMKSNVMFARLYKSAIRMQSCANAYPNLKSVGNGAEDGFYIGSPAAKTMLIPRTLRMSINPRDNLDISGAIQLRGGAVVIINYM